MTLNLAELKDEPLGLAPTSPYYACTGCAICYTDQKNGEPLGKHHIQAIACFGVPVIPPKKSALNTGYGVRAADDVRSFTFDVDGLSDEALDPDYSGRSLPTVCAFYVCQ